MIEKSIIYPNEIGELIPHWYELDPAKLIRIQPRYSRHVKVRDGAHGNHIASDVFNVPPILTCPSGIQREKEMIINGKHRAALAYLKGLPLVKIRVDTRSALKHCLPRESRGNLDITELERTFDDRAAYEEICRNMGVPTIKELVAKEIKRLQVTFNGFDVQYTS